MTSTGQEPPAKVDASLEPAKQAEAKEARQVPLDALVELRHKNAEASKRIAELEAQLAQPKKIEQPAAAAQPLSDVEVLRKDLAEIKAQTRLRNLTSELGLASEKQAQSVIDLLDKNPGLDPTEALELAAKRKPDDFKDRGQPGFDPRIHGSSRPRGGTAPEPKESDKVKRLKAIKTATGSDKARLTNNYVGALAAKAMGWESDHKRIPL